MGCGRAFRDLKKPGVYSAFLNLAFLVRPVSWCPGGGQKIPGVGPRLGLRWGVIVTDTVPGS